MAPRALRSVQDMVDWGEEECMRIGCSLATFLRKRKTGEVAVAAWVSETVQPHYNESTPV